MSAFKKIRVLYVNHTGEVSGAEKVLIDLVRLLDRERYEPAVICPPQGGLAAEMLKLGVEQHPMPTIRARFAWRPDHALASLAQIFKAVATLRKEICEFAPDLIHANSVRAGIATTLAAAGTGRAVIWHVHDTLPRHPLSCAIRVLALLSRHTQVIAVSQSAAKRFCGWLPLGEKVHTIHNGVDLSKFPIKQLGRSVFRDRIAVSDEDFLICAVGQICDRKGLLELINALAQVQRQAPRIHVAIVGRVVFEHEREYLKALHAVADATGVKGRVHFTGELSNVSPALQAADLLVLNSHDEPFGLVLIEAMASGTPVLATRVGGIPEIVTDSENGWLVEKGDTAALASKMLELSQKPADLVRTAERAYHITCPMFSIREFQWKLAQFYAEVERNSGPMRIPRSRPALARSINH